MPAPAPGQLAVTMVGHATVMLTTSQTRVLTDPCFARFLCGLRRAEDFCLDARDADAVDLVLLSHAHRDHLHLPSLRQLPRSAALVVPPGCDDLVRPLGFAEVHVLEPGAELRFRDLDITAVAARHDGRRGPWDPRWRGAASYLVRAPAVSALFVGDSGYFSGFRELGRRMRPDVALLPIAGYEPLALRETHMSPLDAVAAFEDLGAHLLIPIAHGAFPLGYEPLAAPAGVADPAVPASAGLGGPPGRAGARAIPVSSGPSMGPSPRDELRAAKPRYARRDLVRPPPRWTLPRPFVKVPGLCRKQG